MGVRRGMVVGHVFLDGLQEDVEGFFEGWFRLAGVD
jgi:hypothetical protein